jgi:hypothetical protein
MARRKKLWNQSVPTMDYLYQIEDRDGVRFSWNVWPSSRIDASVSRMVAPLGAMYTPLKRGSNVPMVFYEPVQCKGSCKTYLNPYWYVERCKCFSVGRRPILSNRIFLQRVTFFYWIYSPVAASSALLLRCRCALSAITALSLGRLNRHSRAA